MLIAVAEVRWAAPTTILPPSPSPGALLGHARFFFVRIALWVYGQMRPLMRAAKGFISHCGGPSPTGGWRVVEVWDTEKDGTKWFDESVKPNLPPGIIPDRKYYPLYAAFTK